MNKFHNKSQQGLTIIELLVAASLGILLVGVAIQALLSNKRAFDSTNAINAVQDNGRFINFYIKNYLLRAGYDDYFTSSGTGDISPPVMLGSVCSGKTALCSSDSDSDSDQLSIAYTVPSDQALSDGFTTCNGTKIDASNFSSNTQIIDVFRLVETTGEYSFQCGSFNYQSGNQLGNGYVELSKEVRSFQVLYGVSSGEGSLEPEKYVKASAVTGESYKDIRAIKYGVLVSSNNAQSPLQSSKDFYLLDSDKITLAAGSALHRMYSTMVMLRN